MKIFLKTAFLSCQAEHYSEEIVRKSSVNLRHTVELEQAAGHYPELFCRALPYRRRAIV